MKHALLATLALLILATTPALAQAPVDDAIARMQAVDYVRTIDGDSVVVSLDGEVLHVRLFAVDAPELEEGTVHAFTAALYLATMLSEAEEVWLETDEEAQLLDPWDRTLAWLWIRPQGFEEGRLLVQSRLLNEGLCTYYPRVQSKRYPELKDAYREGGGFNYDLESY